MSFRKIYESFNIHGGRTSQSQQLVGSLHPPPSMYLSLTAIRLISLRLALAVHACDGTSHCGRVLEPEGYVDGKG